MAATSILKAGRIGQARSDLSIAYVRSTAGSQTKLFSICCSGILLPASLIVYTGCMRLTIKVIGTVDNTFTRSERLEGGNDISHIVIDPAYSEALEGIDDFSHVVVVFWLDRITVAQRRVLKVHPRGNPCNPLTGVFATHSPARPNPIAVTTVQLVGRKGNVLSIKGLDALNGTPVIDIKGYFPSGIAESQIKLPGWATSTSSQLDSPLT